MAGLFITFEGIDGVGKTTQAGLLADYLRQRGYPVVLTGEPGGTSLGAAIRELVLHRKEKVEPLAEVLLYLADRAQHVATVIRPALEQGEVVICDRFGDSTLAYQGYGRGLDLDELRRLHLLTAQGLCPDHTFLLDLDVAAGRRRRQAGPDRLEAEAEAFHTRVRAGYLALAAAEPERVTVIPGHGSIRDTFAQIRHHMEELLSRAWMVRD